MVKKIKSTDNSAKNSFRESVDSSVFSDEVASQTSWVALNTYSGNFDVRKLVADNQGNFKYVPTCTMVVFCSVFIFVGLLFLVALNPSENSGWVPLSIENVLGWMGCLVFVVAGLILMYFSLSPICFLRNKRIYSRGRGEKRRK